MLLNFQKSDIGPTALHTFHWTWLSNWEFWLFLMKSKSQCSWLKYYPLTLRKNKGSNFSQVTVGRNSLQKHILSWQGPRFPHDIILVVPSFIRRLHYCFLLPCTITFREAQEAHFTGNFRFLPEFREFWRNHKILSKFMKFRKKLQNSSEVILPVFSKHCTFTYIGDWGWSNLSVFHFFCDCYRLSFWRRSI